MKKTLLCTLSMLLIALTTAVTADLGPYVGANVGYSATGTSTINQTEQLASSNNNQHFGWNLNLGVMFFGLGVEAGYIRFADLDYQSNTQSTSTGLSETHLALRTTQNIGPLFFVAKIGYGQLQRGSFTVNNINVNNANPSGVFWGFGLGLNLTPTWRVQAQYQQIQGNNEAPTANITTVGLGWTFL